MRWLFLLAALPIPGAAPFTWYSCGATLKGYWRHAGYNHPFVPALDYDRGAWRADFRFSPVDGEGYGMNRRLRV